MHEAIENADRLRELADEIRILSARTTADAWNLGRVLSEARQLFASNSHEWAPFCESVHVPLRYARRFMAIYRAFPELPAGNALPTALEMLSKPSVPESARREAEEHVAKGKRLDTVDARKIIRRHGQNPTKGSNRGRVRDVAGAEKSDLYRFRCGVRVLLRECEPDKRLTLVGTLHEMIDAIWNEVESGLGGHPDARRHGMPSPDEIGARCAEIRANWTDDERQRRTSQASGAR